MTCGCTDYHMADCHLRTGGGGVDAATIYEMTIYEFDRYMEEDL